METSTLTMETSTLTMEPPADERRISNRKRRRRWMVDALSDPGCACAYCGEAVARLGFDHVHPRSRGGHDGKANRLLACKRCDYFKGDRTPAEMIAVLRRMLDVLEPFVEKGA